MNHFKKKYKNLLFFIFLLVICIFYQWGFWNTYFAQDEWNGFGVAIFHAHQPLWQWFNMSTSLHFFPFNILSWLGMYKAFGYQVEYYVLVAILLQTIASYLVFVLTSKLSKSNLVAVLTALLFLTNSRSRTAFLHLGVYLNTIPFFIFIILFFIYLAKIIKKPQLGLKDAVVLLKLFFCSAFFREEGVILIPLLPVFLFIYNKKAFAKENIKFFVVFYTFAISFLIYRVFLQLANPGADSISSRTFFQTYLYNVTTFPYKLFVQNIIDGYYTVQLFVINSVSFLYPTKLPFEAVNTALLDFVFLIIFNIFAVAFFIITRNVKDKLFWKNIIFCCILVVFNAGILAAIGRSMVRIEERYLYFSGFAVLFIVSLLLVHIYNNKSRNYFLSLAKKAGVLVIIIYFLVSSYSRIQEDIRVAQAQGQVRKQIVSDINRLHPTIPKDTIVYVKCKEQCIRNSEFGLSNEIVLPFSSGPGWIILLQYAKDNEEVYEPFFKRYNGEGVVWSWQTGEFKKSPVKEFLWDMGSQGYRKINGYGFGYFTDIDLLRKTLRENSLKKDIVIGLEYDEKAFIIREVSAKVQKEL